MYHWELKTNIITGRLLMVQSETAEEITEALRILTSWNPDWQPPYSEAKMGAINFHSVSQL